MGMLANVVCKTAGIAGMSAVLYDAFSVAGANAKRTSLSMNADHFERIHTAKRTLSTESPVSNTIQSKVSDFRENNFLIPVYGSVKGFLSGLLTSLGDNIVPVSFAALALTTKGFFSKLGAWGVAGYGAYIALKEGFGFGKHSPMD